MCARALPLPWIRFGFRTDGPRRARPFAFAAARTPLPHTPRTPVGLSSSHTRVWSVNLAAACARGTHTCVRCMREVRAHVHAHACASAMHDLWDIGIAQRCAARGARDGDGARARARKVSHPRMRARATRLPLSSPPQSPTLLHITNPFPSPTHPPTRATRRAPAAHSPRACRARQPRAAAEMYSDSDSSDGGVEEEEQEWEDGQRFKDALLSGEVPVRALRAGAPVCCARETRQE